jgi:hypothetical protein
MTTNWKTLPYNHVGRWEKKFQSIFDPNSKITWPQFIAEMVVYWRCQFFKNYQDVKQGTNWYHPIEKDVRNLNQQAPVICNHFPHPDDESLVIVAFKNFFRKNRPTNIGRFCKSRSSINKKTGREKLNITQPEKDIILGVQAELDRLVKQRQVFQNAMPVLEDTKTNTFKTRTSNNKNKISQLIELENKLRG